MPTVQKTRSKKQPPPSFESAWTLIQENAKAIKENAKEMREFRKSQKETERVLKESKKALDIQIGSLTNLFGDFTLGMVSPKIREKFSDKGLTFLKTNLNTEVNDEINDIAFEIDIFLENSKKAMLVEVKTKLTKDRINKHIKRLEKMRKYADIHGDKRIFLGALAGFTMTGEVRKIALNQGFYLIEPDGENFNITSPNGKPKEW